MRGAKEDCHVLAKIALADAVWAARQPGALEGGEAGVSDVQQRPDRVTYKHARADEGNRGAVTTWLCSLSVATLADGRSARAELRAEAGADVVLTTVVLSASADVGVVVTRRVEVLAGSSRERKRAIKKARKASFVEMLGRVEALAVRRILLGAQRHEDEIKSSTDELAKLLLANSTETNNILSVVKVLRQSAPVQHGDAPFG